MKLAGFFIALGLASTASAESGLVDTSQSPFAAVRPVGLLDVRWTEGFWARRFAVCRDQMVPAMWELMRGTDYKPFFEHFRRAAGLSEGGYHGAKWNDGDFYKWMEAAIVVMGLTGDETWKQRIDEIIEVIGQAQREDGYLHTPVLIGQRQGDPDARPFQDRFAFEMYNMGHLITAACVHRRVTGEDQFLAIARKTADFLDRTFENPSSELARNSVCPSHYMGVIELYRLTRETRYLELAKKLIEMRDLVAASGEGGDDNQDRLPFHEQTEVMGHAVRANYLYAGVADLYAEAGDDRRRETLEDLWRNLVERRMYLTGGGALYDGAAPDGSKEQAIITRIHQAYGRNYQLPNTTAHNETCANIGNVLWNWRMFLVTGEARYLDVLELALYNSVLSGVSLEGRDFFYVNPLRTTDPLPVDLRWSRERVPFVTSFCCPLNLVRMVTEVGTYAYARSEDALWVNLYGGSLLETDGFTLRQETAYPWDGTITLTWETAPEQPCHLRLRIPGWTSSAIVSVNGRRLSGPVNSGTFHTLDFDWEEGDRIELRLAMEPQLMEAHPLVEENRNEVAVKRGPIVYCLESVDLPSGVSLSEVRIPANMDWEIRYDDRLLQGVSVLQGTLQARKTASDWSGRLYRPWTRGEAIPVETRLIPYYALANRGRGEMSVWLPLAIE